MKIHSLRGRLHMQICDFEHRERMWKTGPAQAMGLPPKKGSVHRIIETVTPCPDNRRPLQGNRQGHPLQTNTYGQFHIIIQEQAFCGHISAQSGNRKGIHKISELQRCTVYSFERAVGHGRDCRIYPPEPFLKACPMQGGLQKVYISLTIL